jgi:prepilin signal peptidase PulO-like enzyme (type II secretory pathway)
MILGLIILIFGFTEPLIFYLGILIFFSPLIYIYVKSVDESCMIRKVVVGKLCIGDWLYNDIKVGTKVVKANWDGLIQKEINLIKKKHKSVLIRQGIPFTPVFLISFLIMGIFLLTKFPSLFQFF